MVYIQLYSFFFFILLYKVNSHNSIFFRYNTNSQKVNNVLAQRTQVGSSSISTIIPKEDDIISITDVYSKIQTVRKVFMIFFNADFLTHILIICFFQKRVFWIKAKSKITNLSQKFWYVSCDKCNKLPAYDYQEKFTCDTCKNNNCIAVPRFV